MERCQLNNLIIETNFFFNLSEIVERLKVMYILRSDIKGLKITMVNDNCIQSYIWLYNVCEENKIVWIVHMGSREARYVERESHLGGQNSLLTILKE